VTGRSGSERVRNKRPGVDTLRLERCVDQRTIEIDVEILGVPGRFTGCAIIEKQRVVVSNGGSKSDVECTLRTPWTSCKIKPTVARCSCPTTLVAALHINGNAANRERGECAVASVVCAFVSAPAFFTANIVQIDAFGLSWLGQWRGRRRWGGRWSWCSCRRGSDWERGVIK